MRRDGGPEETPNQLDRGPTGDRHLRRGPHRRTRGWWVLPQNLAAHPAGASAALRGRARRARPKHVPSSRVGRADRFRRAHRLDCGVLRVVEPSDRVAHRVGADAALHRRAADRPRRRCRFLAAAHPARRARRRDGSVGVRVGAPRSLAASAGPLPGHAPPRALRYSNAIGIFLVLGIVLAIGLSVAARSPATRLAVLTPLLVLVPTLYLTSSRGAWVALPVGIAASLYVGGAIRSRAVLLSLLAVGIAVA